MFMEMMLPLSSCLPGGEGVQPVACFVAMGWDLSYHRHIWSLEVERKILGYKKIH